MSEILNKKTKMEYRRFGKTEKQISVITLGGMRFKNVWDEPRDKIPKETFKQGIKTVKLALDAGINNIETAWAYVKSETLYGKVLNEELNIPRTSYHLMTKGNPTTASEMRKMVENQLSDLQTDYIDFYGWHGINNEEIFQESCKTGGPVEELLRLKEEGVIKHVGFSTHAPVETIIKSLGTGLFEFVNLHYYYFHQRNIAAVKFAREKDLGVFIISPNEKGGHLFNAPQKVKNATLPLTPIQWNARFCLQTPAVHTLTFGITEESHFKEMRGIFPTAWSELEQKTKNKLDSFINDDEFASYQGYDIQNDPSRINIPAVLRFRKLWKCYDMKDFGKYRYNMFQEKGHWLPGHFATDKNISNIDLSKVPDNIPLKKMLAETHKELYKPEIKMIKKDSTKD